MSRNPRARVGDKAWFVEWCYKLGVTEEGDGDPDSDKIRCRRFATREAAIAFAKAVWPETVGNYGVVGYHPATFVAYDEDKPALGGFWETDADEEFYEGPEEETAAGA